MRALVLEPEAGARGKFAAALRARGHAASACSSVDEAWEAYQRERPALAFLNWTGAEGPELCRRIRATPAGRQCLILATGLGNNGTHVESALEVGVDDYLPGVAAGATLTARLAVAERRARQIEEVSLQPDIEDRRTYDPLTSLPNRAIFSERLRQALGRLRRQPSALFAILFVDLDRFKVVNDTLGHLVGDQVLVTVARRLESCLRPGDEVGRFGGDEFAVLLDSIKDVSDATRVADRILNELRMSIETAGHEVFVSASIGIAVPATGDERPEDVLQDADAAMYRAKAAGRARYEVFDEAMRQRVLAQLRTEDELRRALMRRELCVYYQPIVRLSTGRIVGVEALSRWQHPQRGLVLPEEFVALAERTGLIVPLGELVLEEACSRVHDWQQRFHFAPPLCLSVNISGRQFAEQDFAERIDEILRRTSLAADCLRLDISEGVVGGADAVGAALTKLRSLGVHLHIDDFGTGSSSLGRLWGFPADTLKVDRSFILQMNHDGVQTLVRTIVALARGFG